MKSLVPAVPRVLRVPFSVAAAPRARLLPGLALLTAGLLQGAPETPLHTRVTVRYDNVPAADALRDIGSKAGVTFAGAEQLLATADHVTLSAVDREAGRVAVQILRPRGVRLDKANGSEVTLAKRDPLDEFRAKPEPACEFAEKPRLTREVDKVTIAFATKGWCDVTVAIEDAGGKIIRHLASGVLGENAPEPLVWNSKRQVLVWDGKNDQEVYVDDKNSVVVRVSLGLQPQFEKTLFWSPHKRQAETAPLVRAAPEGVYVYEGQGVDHLRLFDHQGKYLRTVYPTPADKLEQVQGVKWATSVQTGRKIPLKTGYHQSGFLTSAPPPEPPWEEKASAYAFAVHGERIALARFRLNRLGTDGSSAGLPLEGPEVWLPMSPGKWGGGGNVRNVSPWSAEFSPDGKKLYLAGYAWTYWDTSRWDCHPAVMAMDFEKGDKPALFAGTLKEGEFGKAADQFHCATSVACDAQGRVYVSDYMNDRVQVFSPEGKLLQSVAVEKPALVRVHQKTGEIYVFSWPVWNVELSKANAMVKPKLTHLGPLEDPKKKGEYPLPLPVLGNWWTKHPPGPLYCGEIDSWTEPATLWLSTVRGGAVERGLGSGGDGFGNYGTWENAGAKGYVVQDGKLALKCDFGKETVSAVVRATPPILQRQRLYVNPANGKLYVAEADCGVMKAFNQLVEINPETGKIRLVGLPLGAEDMAFDLNGMAYLRTDTMVARYDPAAWREIPWDYGEERKGHSYGMGARGADLQSGLPTPGHRSFSFWQLGGIYVTAKGHLVVTTCNGAQMEPPKLGLVDAVFGQGASRDFKAEGSYVPAIYPGRQRWGEIHIWDAHGKLIREDAIPGMGHLNGIGADADDGLYMLSASRRLIDGKAIDPAVGPDVSGTLVKITPGRSRVLSPATGIPVPLSPEARPKRPLDMEGYTTSWIDNADWLYGGVGFCVPGGCICWNCRFSVDYFGRSFTPEPLVFGVGILDSRGNLIARVGRPGNVDDGKPLDPKGGPQNPRSIGGDELSLWYACYVASHTDRRLFIADAGNARIASVKLGYRAEERLALKDAVEQKK
jgi:hypothetical protein